MIAKVGYHQSLPWWMGASGAPALIPSVPARIAMSRSSCDSSDERLVSNNAASAFCSTSTATQHVLTTTPSQRTQRRILHRSRRFLQAAGRRGHSHPQTPENCDNSTGFIGSMNLIAPTCHTQVHLQHTRGSMSLLLRILRLPSPGAKHICVAGHFLCLPFLRLDLCAGAQLDLSTLSLRSG